MKEFVILLLGFALVTLIAYPVQFVAADHLEPGIGIYKDETNVNIIPIRDSKYQIYLQVEVRNAQGQLVGIFEGTHGNIIPHKITDLTFDEKLGEKEIVTIDNIKYEKAKYSGIPDGMINWQYVMPIHNISAHFVQSWFISLCSVFDDHGYTCITPFQAITAGVSLVEDDVVEDHWTILRIIN